MQYYDVAGVMEGYSTHLDPARYMDILAVGDGWEMNTGAFAVRRRAMPLLQKWVRIFGSEPERFVSYQSGEQQGL